ncbi:hypothetical protein BJX66DRAFT_304972 [Aspergillus keveii]|uniref:Secreted protein n=1 Tax=Aspergillus keveii TaxID=714993 RepID=A0ABR4G4S8_9EURO
MILLSIISLVGLTADIDNESVTATNIPGDDGSSWLAATGENHRSGAPIRARRRTLSIANCEAGEVRAMIDRCIRSRLCRRENLSACGERLFARRTKSPAQNWGRGSENRFVHSLDEGSRARV